MDPFRERTSGGPVSHLPPCITEGLGLEEGGLDVEEEEEEEEVVEEEDDEPSETDR